MEPIINEALDQSIFLALLIVLVVGILYFFKKDREEHKKERQGLLKSLEEKNNQITALQTTNNERLMAMQSDMINAINNQTLAIQGVKLILSNTQQK